MEIDLGERERVLADGIDIWERGKGFWLMEKRFGREGKSSG